MNNTNTLQLECPLDMHLHLRQGAMLKTVAPLSAASFSGAVIMPNLVPPIDTLELLTTYQAEIEQATNGFDFTPFMTLFFRTYSEHELLQAKDRIIGIKLYPAGITTNSESGVASLQQATPTLTLMQELGIPLLVHGESNGFVLDREQEFLSSYAWMAETFPDLKIIMEHITTRKAVDFLDRYPNVYATVTLHHLLITLDDVAGGFMAPHLFCKPIAKRPVDRNALLEAALAVHPKIMFGSDSAPHPVHKKECSGCAAGVFTAPVALPLLAELFEQHNALNRLQTFVSDNARRIYGIELPHKVMSLVKSPWTVPEKYGDVVPFYAGHGIAWQQN